MADPHWLATVYQEFRRPLFLTAWNVVRCVSLAEDAVHAAFVRLVNLPAPPREPKLYAFRAVRNAALDLAKSRARRREESIDATEDIAKLQEFAEGSDFEECVTEALDELDFPSREVIELHLHSDLTFQEIAQLLDEPASTVASRYRRALHKIRKEIEVRRG
jgi:RNA polymerase sigma-70 factor, ECF subfamily